MVWTREDELPQRSVAMNVRMMVRSPGHVPGMDTSLELTDGFGSQLSVAVALPPGTGSSHSIVLSGGTPLIVGPCVSTTVTTCVADAVLPAQSRAVYVRVMTRRSAHVPATVDSLTVNV